MTHKDIIAEHFEPREAVFSRRVRGYVGVCPVMPNVPISGSVASPR